MSDKKVVVVTGSASGIGLAIAKIFYGHKHMVYGIDVNHSIDCNYFNKFKTYVRDITRPEHLPDIKDVNILINNAGCQNEDDIKTNLIGTINVTKKYAYQEHIECVINIASTSGHTGAEFPEYAASKGGVLTYTKSLANELACYGARCNSISPGGVYTDLNKPVIEDKEKFNKIMEETPLKKWAQPEEIAQLVYFLAIYGVSITGQDIVIDNGEMVKSHFIW